MTGAGATAGGDPLAIARAVAQRHGLPLVQEGEWPADPALPAGVSLRFLRAELMLPIGPDGDGAERVVLADPARHDAVLALATALGRPVALRVGSVPAILSRLDALSDAAPPVEDMALPDAGDPDDSAQDAPIIAALDQLLLRAVEARATDLHFEPGPSQMVVRQRVDGMLRPAITLPSAAGRALVARLKILAGLNIAERRLAQDGHIRQIIAGRPYDLRCATLPMVDGEGAALRILAGRQSLPALGDLGLSARDEGRFRHALGQSSGLILVTGPTGSGKTTTLAAATGHLNRPFRKIVSIEDPVEYHIAGISQVQVNTAIGLTFSAALRAFLRADPDVMLVGEVRDTETAQITVQAALTGHLVLTTLHTNSAADAVTRLTEMGVEPYLLAATLRLSVGQRLVRVLCRHCRLADVIDTVPFAPTIQHLAGHVPGHPLHHHRAVGCDQCGGTGYFGRMALVEVMPMTDALRARILAQASAAELHAIALADGMVPLTACGLAQVIAGHTTLDEVLRVAQDG